MSEPISSPNTTVANDANATSASEPMGAIHELSDETHVPGTFRSAGRTRRLISSGRSRRFRESERAGLSFPVGRIRKYMKEFDGGHRYSATSAVYMAAVLEYLTSELVEGAGNHAKAAKKKRITPRHIRQCTGTDPELNFLLRNVIVPEGGVVPHIDPFLLPHESVLPKRGHAVNGVKHHKQDMHQEQIDN